MVEKINIENGKNIVNNAFKSILSISEGVFKKILYPFVFSCIVFCLYIGLNITNNESFWAILPLILPIAFIGFILLILYNILNVKENISEITESLSNVKELKSLDIQKNESGKIKLKNNIKSVLTFVNSLNQINTLKDSPAVVLEALNTIKKITLVINPLSLFLTFCSVSVLWVYSVILLVSLI